MYPFGRSLADLLTYPYISGMLFRLALPCTLLVLLLIISATSLHAQHITDARNVRVATIRSDGRVLTPQNVTLGFFKPDGRIIDAQNRLVGRLEKDGRVHNAHNMFLGRIDEDGKVWSARNVLLGSVDDDGRVRSARNILLAKGPGIDTRLLAVFLFFGMWDSGFETENR